MSEPITTHPRTATPVRPPPPFPAPPPPFGGPPPASASGPESGSTAPSPGQAAALERSLHRLYLRAAWMTLGRLPLLDTSTRAVVEGRLIALCRRLDAEPVAATALATRVHVLFRYKPGHAAADFVRRLKRGSEEELRRAGHPVRWARGYAITTVSPEAVRREMRRLARLGEREERAGPPARRRP